MLNKIAYKVALAGLLASLSGTASALGEQWYLGVGGGVSKLMPDNVDNSINTSDKNSQVGTVFIGRDFDNRSSGQLQLYSLGESRYEDDQSSAGYRAGDASLLYRFYDSRDRQPRGTLFGTSLYGRFGFGFMQRDSDLLLDTDTPVYFGAGAGIETYLTFNLAMRLEALYHDTDATSATLTLVNRFGGRRPTPPTPVRPVLQPETQTEAATTLPETIDYDVPDSAGAPIELTGNTLKSSLPVVETPELAEVDIATNTVPDVEIMGTATETQAEPEVVAPPTDSDADGISDELDRCPDSAAGYPVTARGCPVFGGILSNLTFNEQTADLASTSYAVLDTLVQQLLDFPDTYIELVAHTDNTGTDTQQSQLTRQRLRSIGVYLVRHGISQDRLLLRSFGGSRPNFDNATVEGRRRNNRIEVLENP